MLTFHNVSLILELDFLKQHLYKLIINFYPSLALYPNSYQVLLTLFLCWSLNLYLSSSESALIYGWITVKFFSCFSFTNSYHFLQTQHCQTSLPLYFPPNNFCGSPVHYNNRTLHLSAPTLPIENFSSLSVPLSFTVLSEPCSRCLGS